MNQDMYGVVKPMMKGSHAVFAGPLAAVPAPLPPMMLPIPVLLPSPPFLPVPVPIPLSSKQMAPMMSGSYRSTPIW
jgi:hypothetical protein